MGRDQRQHRHRFISAIVDNIPVMFAVLP